MRPRNCRDHQVNRIHADASIHQQPTEPTKLAGRGLVIVQDTQIN